MHHEGIIARLAEIHEAEKLGHIDQANNASYVFQATLVGFSIFMKSVHDEFLDSGRPDDYRDFVNYLQGLKIFALEFCMKYANSE
jgi:hypothetical protein